MATVLIAGGSGLVGKHLSKQLKEKGYDVIILSRVRKQDTATPSYIWNFNTNEIEKEAIDKSDYIIHLAGANIGAKRWTKSRKEEIINSRTKTTKLIFDSIRKQNINIKAYIAASAIGYYGTITTEKIFKESDIPANDFLGNVCMKWEEKTDTFKEIGIRTVIIRTGVVLSKEKGALSKMITPVKIGVGSAIGTGKQYLPWIHIGDLCDIYIKAIEDQTMEGSYNAVAPDFKTNKDFTKILASVLNKPFWFPNIPAFTMKMIFGEMSSILLKGSRVSSDLIISKGYHFTFPNLKNALMDLLTEKTKG